MKPRKAFTVAAAMVLAIHVLDLGMVLSTPRVGLSNPSFDSPEASGVGERNLDRLYIYLHENRPRAGDPTLDLFRLQIIGLASVESVMLGTSLWDDGLFGSCGIDFDNLSQKQRNDIWVDGTPSATASSYFPVDRHLQAHLLDVKDYHGGRLGRELSGFGLGWFVLGDMCPCTSISFFTQNCALQANKSKENFVGDFASRYLRYQQRMDYVESVLDGTTPWKGIYYLSHYPRYGKTLVVLKDIDVASLSPSNILVDGRQAAFERYPPLLFIDGSLDEGLHSLKVVQDGAEYSLDFKVSDADARIFDVTTSLMDGVFMTVFYDKDPATEIKDVLVDFEGVRRQFVPPQQIPGPNATLINVTLFDGFRSFDNRQVNMSIRYLSGGKTRWLNRSMIMVEEE